MVIALLVGITSVGCYKPNIRDGGLLCSDGGLCPDGFHCAANGTCKEGGATKCQPASPRLEPICTPDPGIDCDPVCQSRCDCGRCNLVGAELTCVPAGDKQRGDFCNPVADDCAPGNVCLSDCNGKVAGRCFRFCGNGTVTREDLCGGQACNVPVNDVDGGVTDLTACAPPAKACNAAGDGSDCGSSALGCYVDVTGAATVCDCKGASPPAGNCSVFNSCVPGYRCISMGLINGGQPTCVKTCAVDGASGCSAGTCQRAGSGAFGFCPP
jgi:hypothetical protein